MVLLLSGFPHDHTPARGRIRKYRNNDIRDDYIHLDNFKYDCSKNINLNLNTVAILDVSTH